MKQTKHGLSEHSVVRAFQRCRDALTRSIIKMSVKPEDVDDILQETFLQAYSAEQKRKIESPQGYLFVISRNLVIKRASDRSKEIKAVIDDVISEADEQTVDAQLHEKRRFNALNDAMRALPDRTRQAILLRKVYGFSSKEIAAKMGVSKSSVDKYIANGIKQCERSLHTKGYNMRRYGGNASFHQSADQAAKEQK